MRIYSMGYLVSRINPYILILVLLFLSCEKIEPNLDNPRDPDSPDYEPPTVSLIAGPTDGDTIETSTVEFEWEGNQTQILFSHSLDGSSWSLWSSQKYARFDYLDEGTHVFIINGKYQGGEEVAYPDTAVFIVDAIQGPSLRFYRLYNSVSNNEQFTVDIIAEEVDSVSGAEINVEFDAIYLYLDSISIGDFFSLSGGEIIAFDSLRNDLGNLQLDIGTLGGNPVYVSGTGLIVRLHFTSMASGQT